MPLAELVTVKSIGLGMALAVAVDALVIRTLLVPATMRLLGDLNWWAPAPLARLQRRLGLGHGEGMRPHRRRSGTERGAKPPRTPQPAWHHHGCDAQRQERQERRAKGERDRAATNQRWRGRWRGRTARRSPAQAKKSATGREKPGSASGAVRRSSAWTVRAGSSGVWATISRRVG